MTGPRGTVIILFPENLNETLKFEENKIQSLIDLLYRKTKTKGKFEKRAEVPASTSGYL